MKENNNTAKSHSQGEDSKEEDIGRAKDRMTQMPKKKVPWTTFIIIFIVLALFYAVITFAYS